jgi:hypothetical protein
MVAMQLKLQVLGVLAPQGLRVRTKHQLGQLRFVYRDDAIYRQVRSVVRTTDEPNTRSGVHTARDHLSSIVVLWVDGAPEERDEDSTPATGEAERVAERERRGRIGDQVAAEYE